MLSQTTDIMAAQLTWVVVPTLSVRAAQITTPIVLVLALATKLGTRLFIIIFQITRVEPDRTDLGNQARLAVSVGMVNTEMHKAR